jgi:molybdopterin molybdotransferase
LRTNISLEEAQALVLDRCVPVEAEAAPLAAAHGRVLAADVLAAADVPPFDRSPYDGYAFMAADSVDASRDKPLTLKVVEEIPAGSVPGRKIVSGTAAKILTGAPIPEGADAVVMYEVTEFTESSVTIFSPAYPGMDVVQAGEDVRRGVRLAERGDLIDPALAGALAAQGFSELTVFRKPKAGIISTGSELAEAGQPLAGGLIRNSNRYALAAACAAAGLIPAYLGLARDRAGEIAALMERGLAACDVIFSTGGVSVGDYDLTPAALDLVGAETLARGVRLKPGGACAYGQKDGKLIFCLSGNPASAMTNFYAVALPCLRKLCGQARFGHRLIKAVLKDSFNKKSPQTRLISGRLDLSDGTARLSAVTVRGNAVLRTLIGCDAMAIIPAGSPPLPAGTVLEAYLL